jgi:saccharopine dehydrogenase-like NADP-dependent oxidoreductase
MKALVIGIGLQGRAVVHDLAASRAAEEIVAADLDESAVAARLAGLGGSGVRPARVDASRPDDLRRLVREIGPRVVVCMVPPALQVGVARAAVEGGAHFVSTSYAGGTAELASAARERGLVLLPEMGFDPGIDLVLARAAVAELDEVAGLRMYGGGFPEASAADNALRYKVTWTLDGVLLSYRRPARLLRDGRETAIDGERIFDPANVHTLDLPGFGPLEAYPNGDALLYRELYGLGPALSDLGRYTLRWPGHCAFWRPLVAAGFLRDEPVEVDGVSVVPRTFTARRLEPQLRYADAERDLALLRVTAWGRKAGVARTVTCDFVDRRDLRTGLFAMNRAVGCTASIGAQWLLRGELAGSGLLSPARDIEPARLFAELRARGMELTREARDGAP